MSRNLGQLRSGCFSRLAEVSGSSFSDSEIDEFINDEYKYLVTQINQKNDEYFAKDQLTSTTTNEYYSFPADFVKLLMIEIKIPGGSERWVEVQKISIHKKEKYRRQNYGWWSSLTGAKTYYFIKGDEYSIVPVRTSAGNNDLRVWYVYEPTELSQDSHTPAIPSLYHELLKIGACNRARQSVKEPPVDEGLYNTLFTGLLETAAHRVKHKPRQVRMIPGLY